MPKDGRQQLDDAAPVRVEAVPRRGLSRQEAARYVGISTAKFDELVRDGQMPRPLRISSRAIWDLRKLDTAFDRLSGPDEEAGRTGIVQAVKIARRAAAPSSAKYPGHPNAYTADSLADRWTCSGNHVRNLIRRGELQAMEGFGKMIRITPAAVIAFEEANTVAPER